jgi:hypothetical protein
MFSIDITAARRHLKSLDPAAQRFIFLATDDAKEGRPAITLPGTLDDLRIELERLQAQRYGVHVCVNDTFGDRRRRVDVCRVRGVYLELDGPLAAPLPLQPSLRIRTSPGRGHHYFLTTDDAPPSVAEAEAMQRVLCERFGGDPGAKDVARVLRLGGSWHQKAKPFRVEILSNTGRRYSRAQLLAAFPPPPKPKVCRPIVLPVDAHGMRRQALDDLADDARRIAALVEGRRDALWRTACRLAKYVIHDVLAEHELRGALLAAWSACGGAHKHGLHYAYGAIRRALDKASSDPLPPLGRPYQNRQASDAA